MVAQAAGSIAGPTHRNMGTVGGNLCLDTRCIFYNQSEWWRAGQQPLPQDHRRHLPRGAQEPRRVLRHLQRRPGARPDDARRRGRSRRARRASARCRCSSSTSAMRATTARPRATASTTWRCGPASSSPACAPSTRPACARPTTRSASAARSSIRWPASPWRCAARATRSPTCASPSPAPTRAPCCWRAPQALCGGPLDERVFKGLDDLVRDQIMSMKTTFTPGHYRRRVAGVLARRLVRAAVRGGRVGGTERPPTFSVEKDHLPRGRMRFVAIFVLILGAGAAAGSPASLLAGAGVSVIHRVTDGDRTTAQKAARRSKATASVKRQRAYRRHLEASRRQRREDPFRNLPPNLGFGF